MKISFTKSGAIANAGQNESKGMVSVILVPKDKNVFIERDSKGRKVMYFGIGDQKEITKRSFVTLIRRVVKTAKAHRVKKLAISFDEFNFQALKKVDDEERARIIAENLHMANFEFTLFKEKPKEGWTTLDEVVIIGKVSATAKRGFHRGSIIGQGVNDTRVLANTPGGDMTPVKLAEAARKAARGTKIRVRILGKKEMERMKMGAILGVARGSKAEPKFIIMEYRAGKNQAPIVLVGKGITFDTGGLNLKPGSSISDMHMDMSGGAAVIHAIVLAAKLGITKNVVGLIPAAENMVSGESYRPGDILKSMSGKTIEVLNTDAEGRVVLADALTYAKKYKPRLVVDVATLTGAAISALGQRASAILTREEKLVSLLTRLGEESGDYVWPLPLWKEYDDDVKGVFADVANVSTNGHQGGGAINGAAFLQQFADGYPWAHIDIAPRMIAVQGDHLAKGAAGEPVRLLVRLLEEY